MFITTANEVISLMPTARWNRVEQLFGYLEEEERVALEPLLGTSLYLHLCEEYERLKADYVDITATTIKPTHKSKAEPALPYADVTETLDNIHAGVLPGMSECVPYFEEENDVPPVDMKTVRLIRICQQIEFYKMLSHKAGLLTVSFNEGGGINRVGAENYEPASDKDREEMRKDAYMSAGRSIDDLLLFLEADAKGDKTFTELWKEADAFYLNKDLLFQTAQVMKKFSIIKCRMDYVDMVHDIRFCQDTYLEPRIGGKLLEAAIGYANEGTGDKTMDALVKKLRIALAFYVESRRVEIGPQKEKLARRDSMTDAQQAMATACAFIEENLDSLGQAVVDTPIYNKVKEREAQEKRDRENAQAACERRRIDAYQQRKRKLFTGFPPTFITPERK